MLWAEDYLLGQLPERHGNAYNVYWIGSIIYRKLTFSYYTWRSKKECYLVV